ncbi:MAG: hypothetical protein ACE5DI_04155 [Candidatus Micrarchaeia archaeon]
MKKAFFFTIDALLALALFSASALTLFVFSQAPPVYESPSALYVLGRDFIELNTSLNKFEPGDFYQITAFRVTRDNSTFETVTPKLVTRASKISYDYVCCEEDDCVITAAVADGCLRSAKLFEFDEVWVYFTR